MILDDENLIASGLFVLSAILALGMLKKNKVMKTKRLSVDLGLILVLFIALQFEMINPVNIIFSIIFIYNYAFLSVNLLPNIITRTNPSKLTLIIGVYIGMSEFADSIYEVLEF